MGNIYIINDEDVSIMHSKSGYECVIADESIATIENNVITPHKEGVTTLIIQLIDNSSFKCEVILRVTNIIYTDNATLEQTDVVVNLMKNNGELYNRLTIDDGANEIPTIQYDSSIIDYNYQTGLIRAKQVGITTVSIIFNNVNTGFRVQVVDWVYTQVIEVEDCSVFAGDSGVFEYVKFPSTANTYAFSSESDKILVGEDGSFTALKSGVAIVKCSYISEENGAPIEVEFTVSIFDKFTSFDLHITNVDGGACPFYLQDRVYRLHITKAKMSQIERLSVGGPIDVVSKTLTEDGAIVDFMFAESGNIAVSASINMDSYAVNESLTIKVSTIHDTKVWGHYSYMKFEPNQDGIFLLYLNDNSKPSYLKFSLTLEGVLFDGEYEVYLIDENTENPLTEGFYPTETGEYEILFKQNDVEFNRVRIIVN